MTVLKRIFAVFHKAVLLADKYGPEVLDVLDRFDADLNALASDKGESV